MYLPNEKIVEVFQFTFHTLEDMASFRDFLENSNKKYTIGHQNFFDLKICIEEIIVNFFEHGLKIQTVRPQIDIFLRKNKKEIIVDIRDNGGIFDPFCSKRRINLIAPLKERPIGGLGIHLVKTLSDRCYHTPLKKGNRVVVHKRIKD